MLRAFLAAQLIGCAASTTTVVSLQDIDCASCGITIAKALKGMPGVTDAGFDRQRAELWVKHDAQVTEASLLKAVDETGWPAELGAGKGRYAPMPEYPAGADVAWVTRTGERVDLAATVVPGKVTVVDFGATWCRPCRGADEFFVGQLQAGAVMAIRKVNIIDWDSPVAQQHLAGVHELPLIVFYRADGTEAARLSGFKKEAAQAILSGISQ